jgi:hypothetical protein
MFILPLLFEKKNQLLFFFERKSESACALIWFIDNGKNTNEKVPCIDVACLPSKQSDFSLLKIHKLNNLHPINLIFI